jgi:hypothetical protein
MAGPPRRVALRTFGGSRLPISTNVDADGDMSISEIIEFAARVEKVGIVGFLVIACVVLGVALYKMRNELLSVYRQRDRWRLAYVKCRAALDYNKIPVDLSDLADLVGDEPK